VSFESLKSPTTGGQQTQSGVIVSQVVTDMELVSRSMMLEATLASGRYVDFCDKKISLSQDQTESTIWSFLKVATSVLLTVRILIVDFKGKKV